MESPALPKACWACQNAKGEAAFHAAPLTVDHALICKKGGGGIGRHDIIAAGLAAIAKKATSDARGRGGVCVRQGDTHNRGLFVDVSVKGWGGGDREDMSRVLHTDVRVIYPDAHSCDFFDC